MYSTTPSGKNDKDFLYDYLTAELQIDSEIYFLTSGNWFKINRDYCDSIRKRLKNIEDLSLSLSLPALKYDDSNSRYEYEAEYNIRVCNEKKWHLFDVKNIKVDEPRQKFEFCDIITDKGNEFIFVKKIYKGSSSISHLFKQAEITADISAPFDRNKNDLESKLKSHEDTFSFGSDKPVFILAVITKKKDKLCDNLPFFAAVACVCTAEKIEKLGFKVALAKIEYEGIS